MSVRAYMLLDIENKSCGYAVQTLRGRSGVILADRLEGYPNLITMIEADNRKSLAEAIIPVLDCIDGIAEALRLLVTQEGGEAAVTPLALSNSTSRRAGVKTAPK
jgi:hypothetical protein